MNSDEFTYFISERNFVSVVSLLGRLERPALPIFPKILEDLSLRRPKMVIFNCHDLKDLDSCVMGAFAELFACIGSMPAQVSLCFVTPELKERLLTAKLIAPNQIHDNLFDAVGSFLGNMKKAS